jgi:hypothetical protein
MSADRDRHNRGSTQSSDEHSHQAEYTPVLSLVELHMNLRRLDQAKATNFRHNTLHGPPVLDGSPTDRTLRGPGPNTRITVAHVRAWMQAYIWIVGHRCHLHNLPDPMDVPPEWRDVPYRYLHQHWRIKNSYAAAQDSCCSSVWWGYYYQCPLNDTGTARLPTDMRHIQNKQHSIMPRRNAITTPPHPRPSPKTDRPTHPTPSSAGKRGREKATLEKAKTQTKYESDNPAEDDFSSDDSSIPYKGRSSRSDVPNKMRKYETESEDEENTTQKRGYTKNAKAYMLHPNYDGNLPDTIPENPITYDSDGDALPDLIDPGDLMLIDTGATMNCFRTTDYVDDYMHTNRDRHLTMSTASGHTLRVTHTGHVPGIGEVMICPHISANLLSAIQLLQQGRLLVFKPPDSVCANPYATLFTDRSRKIVIPISQENQFEVPLSMLAELVRRP